MESESAGSGSGSRVRQALLVFALLLLVACGCLLALLAIERLRATKPSAGSDSALSASGGTTVDPPRAIADFTLVDQQGQPTSLSDFRGSLVLLTFGYTHCPDVCPLTLNEFRRIRDESGDLRERVRFVFISVDGARDTPEALRRYFDLRGLEGIIGLTGAEDKALDLGADFGLAFERTAAQDDGGYLVNHTTGAFLLDGDGRWIKRYPYGIAPSEIVKDLEKLLT